MSSLNFVSGFSGRPAATRTDCYGHVVLNASYEQKVGANILGPDIRTVDRFLRHSGLRGMRASAVRVISSALRSSGGQKLGNYTRTVFALG